MPHELMYYSLNTLDINCTMFLYLKKAPEVSKFSKRTGTGYLQAFKTVGRAKPCGWYVLLSSGMFSVNRFGIYKAQIMITT